MFVLGLVEVSSSVRTNSTVQTGRRRHVQEASGRWCTRRAGREILSVQKNNSKVLRRFLRFCLFVQMSWDPRAIHRLYNARSAFLHLEFGEGSDDFMTQYPAVTQCFTLSLGQVLGIAAFACFAKFFNFAFLIMIAQLINLVFPLCRWSLASSKAWVKSL